MRVLLVRVTEPELRSLLYGAIVKKTLKDEDIQVSLEQESTVPAKVMEQYSKQRETVKKKIEKEVRKRRKSRKE